MSVRSELLELANNLGIDADEAGEDEWAASLNDSQLADAIVRMRPEAKQDVLAVTSKPTLMNYATGEEIREATADELAASIAAAETDGGAGVIEVDGVSCYVIE